MKIELSRLDELLVAVIDRHTEYVNATPDSEDEHLCHSRFIDAAMERAEYMAGNYLPEYMAGIHRAAHCESAPFVFDDEFGDAEAVSAMYTQVGGDHYSKRAIQPIEFIAANDLNFCEGSIVKYIVRWRDKGGFQDLEKIKQYVDLLIEMENKYVKPT